MKIVRLYPSLEPDFLGLGGRDFLDIVGMELCYIPDA